MEKSRMFEKKKRKMVRIRKVMMVLMGLFVLGLFAMNFYISKIDIRSLEEALPQPTIIYDREGKMASKLSVSKMEAISINEMPEHLLQAVIAAEDKRFYKHHGIDYQGILRAMWRNVKAGEFVEGGSTITQQLAKNVFLTNEKTLKRKWEEFFIAKKIERTYTKDEILEMYLNRIYFGEGAWGVKKAAEIYFGKDVSKLTVSESALLAGLIKAPSALSPIKHYDQAIERRNLVLSLMKEQGYINEKTFLEAKKEKMVFEKKQLDPYKGKYPYYVDHIIDEAINKYGLTENEVLFGGLHIYTEMDQHIQQAVEEVYKKEALFPESTNDQLLQSGTVLLDAKSGGITALVGGRGEHVFRGFNRATQLKRQPGSTMKPLAVYTPALEEGYRIFDLLKDQPFDFNGYQPKNYDHQYRGTVTMYEAVINSLNVPAVWLLNEIGLHKGIDAVERFGIPLNKEDHYLGLALGGLKEGVSPLQMAEAYSVFPNEGVKTEAHAITKIVDMNGETIAEWEPKSTKVTSKEVAQKMTFMLEGVIEEGTGKRAKMAGRDIVGKTGSTQVPISGVDGVKDQWFVGYSPQLVCAVWLGYDHTDQNHYLKTTSSQTVSVIFREIMSEALKDVPPMSFTYPKLKAEKRQLEKFHEQKKKEKKQKKEMLREKKHPKEKPHKHGKKHGKKDKRKKD
ncbi:penicillin-binding protein 2A [Anoxybacillus calidus]|uniref:Penicillin-binding protein 2A n=1 Tax=[Anoxybacillus] calidus TaxID=575178 RepID=A0A7V9YXW7_9BACL|nr:penicillin-binding protein 1A [Anoxybacillus calidus]MBA2870483.1 penicillin-binding protein 2A [Anoxybacillus calidus]